MGSTISSAMEASQEKMLGKQVEMQTIMLQRQLAMQKAVAARQMAAARARAKDMLMFYGAFAAVAFPPLLARARSNPAFLGPVVVISFVAAFQADMAFGNKLGRIRDDAEQMLKESPELFELPGSSTLIVTEIDKAIATGMADAIITDPKPVGALARAQAAAQADQRS